METCMNGVYVNLTLSYLKQTWVKENTHEKYVTLDGYSFCLEKKQSKTH